MHAHASAPVFFLLPPLSLSLSPYRRPSNQALVGSVWVVGPAIGGWLAEIYGFRNAFFVAGAGAALCSLGYTRLPETLKTPTVKEDAAEAATAAMPPKTMREHTDAWWSDVKPLLASRNQRALIAIACVFPLRLSCVTTVVAFHVMTSIEGEFLLL